MDVSYGGENGFNQAIELAAESLQNVKFIQEKKLIGRYFDEISQVSANLDGAEALNEVMFQFSTGHWQILFRSRGHLAGTGTWLCGDPHLLGKPGHSTIRSQESCQLDVNDSITFDARAGKGQVALH